VVEGRGKGGGERWGGGWPQGGGVREGERGRDLEFESLGCRRA